MSRVIHACIDRSHYDLTDTQALEMLAKANRVCIHAKSNERGIDALLTSEHNRRCCTHDVNGCTGTDESSRRSQAPG